LIRISLSVKLVKGYLISFVKSQCVGVREKCPFLYNRLVDSVRYLYLGIELQGKVNQLIVLQGKDNQLFFYILIIVKCGLLDKLWRYCFQ